MGYGGGMGWMWLWWLLLLIGVPALVVGLLWLGRTGGHRVGGRGEGASGPRMSTARQILDERFARGEIDEEEYRRRRRELDG
jgi:putative membrane protein